jgi:hypothetical protein
MHSHLVHPSPKGLLARYFGEILRFPLIADGWQTDGFSLHCYGLPQRQYCSCGAINSEIWLLRTSYHRIAAVGAIPVEISCILLIVQQRAGLSKIDRQARACVARNLQRLSVFLTNKFASFQDGRNISKILQQISKNSKPKTC